MEPRSAVSSRYFWGICRVPAVTDVTAGQRMGYTVAVTSKRRHRNTGGEFVEVFLCSATYRLPTWTPDGSRKTAVSSSGLHCKNNLPPYPWFERCQLRRTKRCHSHVADDKAWWLNKSIAKESTQQQSTKSMLLGLSVISTSVASLVAMQRERNENGIRINLLWFQARCCMIEGPPLHRWW